MMSDIRPTPHRFVITLHNIPHGFLPKSPSQESWVNSMANSDIRRYYRLIRRGTLNLEEYTPIGKSGITVGELALYIIRANHSKRRRRY
jgi:hypothetical protein